LIILLLNAFTNYRTEVDNTSFVVIANSVSHCYVWY